MHRPTSRSSTTPSTIVATWLVKYYAHNVGRTIKCGHAARGGVLGPIRFFTLFKSQRACAVLNFSDLVCYTTASFFSLPTTLRRRFALTAF